MAWNAIFYGIVTVSLLWLLFSCCWACLKLFTPPESVTVEIDDDDASYVPMDYMMAHITRNSLRHRNSNENINVSESDSLESSDSDSDTVYGNDPNSKEGNGRSGGSNRDEKYNSKDDSGIKSNVTDAEEKDSKNDSGSSGNEKDKEEKGDKDDSGINTSKADGEEIGKKDGSEININVTGEQKDKDDSGIKPNAEEVKPVIKTLAVKEDK